MDSVAVVGRRLRRQRLVGERFADLAEALAFFGATQGQDYAEAKWSLGQRIEGVDDSGLDAAFDAGRILRTHVLRPTWHLVTSHDIRWMLELSAPRVHKALGSHYRRLGLDDAVFAHGHEAIERALRPGEPLILNELIEALEGAGIRGERLRHTHVVIHAELDALICSGPRRGKRHTYMLLADRAPDAVRLDRDQALTELTDRYFRSHGPATIRDYAWWSGLTMAEARRGAELAGDRIAEVFTDGHTSYIDIAGADDNAATDDALLLGMFDESVIAYQELRFAFDGDRPERVEPLIRPVLIGGRTVGTWKRALSHDGVTVEVAPFAALDPGDLEAIESAVERFGRFLRRPARLIVAPGV